MKRLYIVLGTVHEIGHWLTQKRLEWADIIAVTTERDPGRVLLGVTGIFTLVELESWVRHATPDQIDATNYHLDAIAHRGGSITRA